MMSTYISVITAVYNDEKFIEKSVESVLNQQFTNFEYIVVDDGSTDTTPAILDKLRQRDKRLIVLTQKNSGAAAARNLAINAAKGDFIAVQDSDDISCPDRLLKQWEQLTNAAPNTLSCTGYNLIDSDDTIFATHNKVYQNINQNVLNGNTSVCHPTLLIPRELLMKVGGYNPFYAKTEDYDLIFRLLENGGRIEKVNECLYKYRIRANSESSMTTDVYFKRAYENHLNRLNGKPENFSEIINKARYDSNYVLKRQAREVFFTENWAGFRRIYIRNFFKLPLSKFFVFFIYSTFPSPLKKFIKSRYRPNGLKNLL